MKLGGGTQYAEHIFLIRIHFKHIPLCSSKASKCKIPIDKIQKYNHSRVTKIGHPNLVYIYGWTVLSSMGVNPLAGGGAPSPGEPHKNWPRGL